MSLLRFQRSVGLPEVFKSVPTLPQVVFAEAPGSKAFWDDPNAFLNTQDSRDDFAFAEILQSDLTQTQTITMTEFAVDIPDEAQILGLSFVSIGLTSNGTDSGPAIDSFSLKVRPILNGTQNGSLSSVFLSSQAFTGASSFIKQAFPNDSILNTKFSLPGYTNNLGSKFSFPDGVFGSDVKNGNLAIAWELISSAQAAGGNTNLRIASVATSFYFFTNRDGAHRGRALPRDRRFFNLNDDIAEQGVASPFFT